MTPSSSAFGCAIAVDGLALLLEFQDLKFLLPDYPDMGKLLYKKAIHSIIEAVRIFQGLPTCLYLDRRTSFSMFLHVIADPSILSPPAAAQTVPMHSVTFDWVSARLNTAPTDLDLPFLDASNFLDYKKDIEYHFQSHGVKQCHHELDQQQLVSSWSKTFCAHLHSSIHPSVRVPSLT
jgi:hypothetical protein